MPILEIQAILAEINADDPTMTPFFGKYSSKKPMRSKNIPSTVINIASRGLKYERLDQLTIDLLLGNR